MSTEITFEVTTFQDLAVSEMFVGSKRDGNRFVGMKIATIEDATGIANIGVLCLSEESPPEIFSERHLSATQIVAKMKNFIFEVQPTKKNLLLDSTDADLKQPGCVAVIKDGAFLIVEIANIGFYHVNITTGEGKPGTLRGAIGVPRWQISQTVNGVRVPWVSYSVLSNQDKAAA